MTEHGLTRAGMRLVGLTYATPIPARVSPPLHLIPARVSPPLGHGNLSNLRERPYTMAKNKLLVWHTRHYPTSWLNFLVTHIINFFEMVLTARAFFFAKFCYSYRRFFDLCIIFDLRGDIPHHRDTIKHMELVDAKKSSDSFKKKSTISLLLFKKIH